MRIAVGSDHRGVVMRAKIVQLLKRLGQDALDIGTFDEGSVDYPDIAAEVAGRVSRGDVWFYRFARPDKRRPVVVISRSDAIDVIRTVMVAPITSTIRGAPSEVRVGVDEGLKGPSAVNLDHVQTVEQSRLRHYIGSLSPDAMERVCGALLIATGCGP